MKIGYVSFETSRLNGLLASFGRRHRRALRRFYSVGAWVGAAGCLLSVLVLLWDLSVSLPPVLTRGALSSPPAAAGPGRLLTPVVPGKNLPWGDVGFLAFATAVSVAVHEAGHAIAAASEGVRTVKVAAFLVAILPGAFVALDAEGLDALPPSRSLRIFAAGVWHNAVLCVLCWGFGAALPLLLFPLYSTGAQIVVTAVPATSPLHRHLAAGDVIAAVNDAPVRNARDWLHALEDGYGHHKRPPRNGASAPLQWPLPPPAGSGPPGGALARGGHPPPGAAGGGFPETFQEGAAEAYGYCVPDRRQGMPLEASPSPLTARAPLCPAGQLPFRQVAAGPGAGGGAGLCLRARDVAAGGVRCWGTGGATLPREGGGKGENEGLERRPGLCSQDEACFAPVLPAGVCLLKISFRPRSATSAECNLPSATSAASPQPPPAVPVDCTPFLVFVGSVGSLAGALQLSESAPRRVVLTWRGARAEVAAGPVWLPPLLERATAYMFHVSAALALLNLAPVYFLDGEAVLGALLACALPALSPSRHQQWLRLLLRSGTILFFCAVVPAFVAVLRG